jgi:hypothetical protein
MNRKTSRAANLPLATIAFLVLAFVEGQVAAQSPIIEPTLPKISETTAKGERRALHPDELPQVAIDSFQRFQRTDGPDDVFALGEFGLGWGGASLTEIIVRSNEAELRLYPDDCPFRYFYRKLSSKELKRLRQFVTDKAVDKLREYDSDVCDGVGYEYVHLTRNGGCRLRMNNPPDDEMRQWHKMPASDPDLVYGDLVSLFVGLTDLDRLKVKYFGTRLPAGLEVLFAHAKQEIRMVWANGDDIRVLVGEYQMWPQEWRALRNGKLGPRVDAPEGFPPAIGSGFFEASRDARDASATSKDSIPKNEPPHKIPREPKNRKEKPKEPKREFSVFDSSEPWQVRYGTGTIRGGRFGEGKPATWILGKGQNPEKLFDQPIDNQLVTPDGHYLVGTLDAKLICYDLTKRKMVPIADAEAANSFEAIHYLPAQKRVLLVRPPRQELRLPLRRSAYEWHPVAYRLLDPVTGKTTELKYVDVAKCLRQPMKRPWQATGKPGVIWMAYTGATDSDGCLGRFDTRELRLCGWTSIDSLAFDNDHCWIDEAAKKIYIVFRGHLLRVPLPDDVFKDWPEP